MTKTDRLLYKYYPYNEYLLEILITKKAWFSKPEIFNDPFDCHLNFDPQIPEDKYEKCLRWQLKREGFSESQIDANIKKLISETGVVNDSAMGIIDEIAKCTLDIIKQIGVLCLTESNTDVTMWAHYADNHKGLCLGFLISEKTSPQKVTYVSDAPIVNFSELLDEELDENEYKWIFSKHHDWKNEKELRVVVPKGDQLWPIPGRISTVTFGLRMDESRREVIKQILEDEPDVQYFEVVRNPRLLQLEIRRI
jgi:Protein of unknown function (DUF2971)